MKLQMILRGVIVIVTVALVVILIRESGLSTGSDDLKAWVDQEVRGHGVAGALLFVAMGALFTGVGLSRQVFAFVAGYAYGVGLGTGLALAGEMGGVIAAFYYARFLGRDVVARKFPRRIKKLDTFLHVNPFMTTLAVRLLPVSHNLVVNCAAGVSSIPTGPFMAASLVGHLPQTLIFALVGSGLAAGIYMKTALAVALFIVSAAIGVYLFRRYRRQGAESVSLEDLAEQPDPKPAEAAR